MVERKNQTMFAAEMRRTFEHLLNYVATESDSDKQAMWESLNKAESHAFPTQYENALMTIFRYVMDSVDTIEDVTIGRKK